MHPADSYALLFHASDATINIQEGAIGTLCRGLRLKNTDITIGDALLLHCIHHKPFNLGKLVSGYFGDFSVKKDYCGDMRGSWGIELRCHFMDFHGITHVHMDNVVILPSNFQLGRVLGYPISPIAFSKNGGQISVDGGDNVFYEYWGVGRHPIAPPRALFSSNELFDFFNKIFLFASRTRPSPSGTTSSVSSSYLPTNPAAHYPNDTSHINGAENAVIGTILEGLAVASLVVVK